MSQDLQNFVKFQKLQLENLVDFEKCCKTHILNYFLAKFGADTAENEQHFAELLTKFRDVTPSGKDKLRLSVVPVNHLPVEPGKCSYL